MGWRLLRGKIKYCRTTDVDLENHKVILIFDVENLKWKTEPIFQVLIWMVARWK